jgi:hypothetical protein
MRKICTNARAWKALRSGLSWRNADPAGPHIANTHLKGVYAPAFPAPSFTLR